MKTCSAPDCTYKVFSHNYCKKHQALRVYVKKPTSINKKASKKVTKRKPPSIAKLYRKAWDIFSQIVKLRYSPDGVHTKCYTCDKPLLLHTSDCQGGHFYDWELYPFLRFHPDNVRVQCGRPCNKDRHGNLHEYRKRLIAEIGIEKVEWLDNHCRDGVKLTRSELLELIEKLKVKLNNVEIGSNLPL